MRLVISMAYNINNKSANACYGYTTENGKIAEIKTHQSNFNLLSQSKRFCIVSAIMPCIFNRFDINWNFSWRNKTNI